MDIQTADIAVADTTITGATADMTAIDGDWSPDVKTPDP